MADFQYSRDSDGVAVISWDVPQARMNTMSWDGMQEMADLFETAFSDDRVKGIVLTSGKPDFSGGMELDALAGARSQADGDKAKSVFRTVMRYHRTFRRIELAGGDPAAGRPGKPIAAALPGTGVGIGYEVPLSCHRIIAADNPRAVIGLPEIKVGLFPGAGGTIRMVRRLGIAAAAPLLLKGTVLSPRKALAARIIDELIEPDRLMDRARQWVLAAKPEDPVKPWDRKGYRMPGGGPYDAQGFMSFVGASAVLNGTTAGVYPAANALMSAIYEGALVPFETALEVEARWFAKVLLDQSSTNMIQTVFLDKKALDKGVRRPASVKRADLRKVGVIGAGMMGSGIALTAARAGLRVEMIDSDEAAAERGKDKAAESLRRQVTSGRMTEGEAQRTLELITPGSEVMAVRGADLVIEAVYEDPAVKAEVIRKVAAAGESLIATNTSTLPISGLAEASRAPDKFLGMHFFSPVDRMMLVEVIRGPATSDTAVAHALDFVGRIRKTPIVVNDARFFYANRCIIPYINEGIRMVGEGVAPALVENAARQCGMPLGPLQLVDETSIDLAASIAKVAREALGDKYAHGDADRVIFELAAKGRLGRKVKAGFYDYDDDGRRVGLWPGLGERFPTQRPHPPAEAVSDRLMMVQALEAVRTLEEGILTDVREGDVGALLGWGFAPWTGGPFSWLDMLLRSRRALTMCAELEARHGSRFTPPDLLRRKAEEGGRFTAH